jgi:hypothetical protein
MVFTFVGTDEEKISLRQSCKEMEMFCGDLGEITASQNCEIYHLQTATLESFEWLEEAKCRELRNKDLK